MATCIHHMDYIKRVCKKCGATEKEIIAANTPQEKCTHGIFDYAQDKCAKCGASLNEIRADFGEPPLQPDGYILPLPEDNKWKQRILIASAMLGWRGQIRVIEAIGLYVRHRSYMRRGLLHEEVKSALEDAAKALSEDGEIEFEELT